MTKCSPSFIINADSAIAFAAFNYALDQETLTMGTPKQFRIEVGKPYIESKKCYPECTVFNYINGDFQLLLAMDSPNKNEINSIKRGLATFEILIHEDIVFFLHKFKPDINWSDSPYHIASIPSELRKLPDGVRDGYGLLLTIILIDSKTGIVKTIRQIALETDLSTRIINQITNQFNNLITTKEYENRIDRAYEKYPETINMVTSS